MIRQRHLTEADQEAQFYEHFYQSAHKEVICAPPYQLVRKGIIQDICQQVPALANATLLSVGSGDGGLEISLAQKVHLYV